MNRHQRLLTEDDPSEVASARLMAELLEEAESLETELIDNWHPVAESEVGRDDALIPDYPVSDLVTGQLTISHGCLESYRSWLELRSDGETLDLTARPYGGYPLLRNALETTALALWVLSPKNSSLRIRRRLAAQAQDWYDARNFLAGKGASVKEVDEKLRRLQRFGDEAGLDDWDAWGKSASEKKRKKAGKPSNRTPKMTELLRDVDRYPLRDSDMSILKAWQLSSAVSHGRSWPTGVIYSIQEEPGTRTTHGATVQVAPRYQVLAIVLHTAVTALRSAQQLYVHRGSLGNQRPIARMPPASDEPT